MKKASEIEQAGMMKDAIVIRGLGKVFKTRGGAVAALDNLDLTVAGGEIFGFLGPNGAGKSTTIKMIMGLLRPSHGKVLLMGEEAAKPAARRLVGYLPENPSFYDYLSASEYLDFVGRTFGLSQAEIAVRSEEVLRRLELWEVRSRPLRGYSKGMVQRLGIAQALLHSPDVYVFDEPMSGLDPIGRALVKKILLELKEAGKSVFFSTHIISDVEAICDRVGIILAGRLRAVETVRAILAAGVVGYRVRCHGNSRQEELDVSIAELPAYMVEAVRQGKEISLIEPRRKSLEEFFLDIVKAEQ